MDIAKLMTWLGVAGLGVGLAGCPGDDGTSDTGFTTQPSLTTGNDTGQDTGMATTSGGGATDESTGTPGDSSTGSSAVCDPPCAGNEICVDGVCFPDGGGDTSTGEPPPTNSDYGPCAAGCGPGEMPVGLMGVDGCFCSPMCDGQGSACPAPNEGTAMPICALELMMGAGPTQCALVCMSPMDCPTGADCVDAGGASICVHPG